MEPVLAFLGNLVGPLFGWMAADRQAEAAEEVAKSQERATRSLVDAAIVQWHELGRMWEAQMGASRDATYWQEATQRTRVYYNFKALQASQGLLLLGAGVGLAGLAVWLGAREGQGVKA